MLTACGRGCVNTDMRSTAILLTICLLVLIQFIMGAAVSYVFGPLAFVLLSVALAAWVGWVLFDCWYLSSLDDRTLALVLWLGTFVVFVEDSFAVHTGPESA